MINVRITCTKTEHYHPPMSLAHQLKCANLMKLLVCWNKIPNKYYSISVFVWVANFISCVHKEKIVLFNQSHFN